MSIIYVFMTYIMYNVKRVSEDGVVRVTREQAEANREQILEWRASAVGDLLQLRRHDLHRGQLAGRRLRFLGRYGSRPYVYTP